MSGRDPVHEDDEGWWFYDETWADRIGPFSTEGEARCHLGKYADFLDRGPCE